MKRRAFGTFALLVALLMTHLIVPRGVIAAQTLNRTILAGVNAPDFSCIATDGQKYSLSNFQGKVVVLEWVNLDCPCVQKQYGSSNMQDMQAKYVGKGVVWLTVCSSAKGKEGYFEPALLRDMLKGQGWKGTACLVDDAGTLGRMYGATSTPTMFVLNKQHRIVYEGAVDNISSTDIKDIPKAKNYVKGALDELLAGKKISIASGKRYGCPIKYKV